ncbi:Putative transmembrane protein (fragment) [Burkholderiales bacterium]
MLRKLLAGGFLVLATVAFGAGEPAKPAAANAAGTQGGPSWAQLNSDQREALAPLAGDWDKFDATRKKKWLDIAVRYKDLSPEGQQTMHERMPDLAKLTPEQRSTARENFKRAYALPPDKRRALTQQFQDLPEQPPPRSSRVRPAPPRRRGRPRRATPPGVKIIPQFGSLPRPR